MGWRNIILWLDYLDALKLIVAAVFSHLFSPPAVQARHPALCWYRIAVTRVNIQHSVKGGVDLRQLPSAYWFQLGSDHVSSDWHCAAAASTAAPCSALCHPFLPFHLSYGDANDVGPVFLSPGRFLRFSVSVL